MPPGIKSIRLLYKVMIDAVIRRMVYTHYKRISRGYELYGILYSSRVTYVLPAVPKRPN